MQKGGFPDDPGLPPAGKSRTKRCSKKEAMKMSTVRESPPWVRGSFVRWASRGFHARGQDAPRRQSLGPGPAGLSGCPRTDGDVPSGARAPVLGLRPRGVSTHGRQRPSDVRAPVLGRSSREEGGEEREGEKDEAHDVQEQPGGASSSVCLGAVTPVKSPTRRATRDERANRVSPAAC